MLEVCALFPFVANFKDFYILLFAVLPSLPVSYGNLVTCIDGSRAVVVSVLTIELVCVSKKDSLTKLLLLYIY